MGWRTFALGTAAFLLLVADAPAAGRGGGGRGGGGFHGGAAAHGGGFHGGGFARGGGITRGAVAVRGFRGGAGWYGNRGFYGRGFYGRGLYGFRGPWYGYRGFYGYPWWGWGGLGGYYAATSWWPYWDLGYPVWSNYCYDRIYDVAPYAAYPTVNDVEVVRPTITVIQTRPRGVVAPASRQVLPPPMTVPNDGTFPYDGGPVNPVPMPRAEPSAVPGPSVAAPVNNRVVSLPARSGKYEYLAYGEKPVDQPAEEKLVVFRVNWQAAR